MDNIGGFLQDREGGFSSKRLQSFVCVLMAILITVYIVIKNLPQFSGLVGVWLGAAGLIQGTSAYQDTRLLGGK